MIEKTNSFIYAATIFLCCILFMAVFTQSALANPLGFTSKELAKSISSRVIRVYRGQPSSRSNIIFDHNHPGQGILLSDLAYNMYSVLTQYTNPLSPTGIDTALHVAQEIHHQFHPTHFERSAFDQHADTQAINQYARRPADRVLHDLVHTHTSVGSGLYFYDTFGFTSPYISVTPNALTAAAFASIHGTVHEALIPASALSVGTFSTRYFAAENRTGEYVLTYGLNGQTIQVPEAELLATGGIRVIVNMTALAAVESAGDTVYSLMDFRGAGLCLEDNLGNPSAAYFTMTHPTPALSENIAEIQASFNMSATPPDNCRGGASRHNDDSDPPPPPLIM